MSSCTLCGLPTPEPSVSLEDIEAISVAGGCMEVHLKCDDV